MGAARVTAAATRPDPPIQSLRVACHSPLRTPLGHMSTISRINDARFGVRRCACALEGSAQQDVPGRARSIGRPTTHRPTWPLLNGIAASDRPLLMSVSVFLGTPRSLRNADGHD